MATLLLRCLQFIHSEKRYLHKWNLADGMQAVQWLLYRFYIGFILKNYIYIYLIYLLGRCYACDPVYQKLIWFQYGSESIKGCRRVSSSLGFVDVTFMDHHRRLCGHMHDTGLQHIDCDPGLGAEDYKVLMNINSDLIAANLVTWFIYSNDLVQILQESLVVSLMIHSWAHWLITCSWFWSYLIIVPRNLNSLIYFQIFKDTQTALPHTHCAPSH